VCSKARQGQGQAKLRELGLSCPMDLVPYKFLSSEEEQVVQTVKNKTCLLSYCLCECQNSQLGVTALSLTFFTESSGKVGLCDGFSCVPLPFQQKSRHQRAHRLYRPRSPGSSRAV